MSQPLPPKKEVALALLERSNVDVYLDPRAKGVVVPAQFRREPRLILKVGLNMPVPIPDLRVDEDSMSCTLSFSRSPFYCVVPWTSVFAMVGEDGRGMVWPDDVPRELAVKVVEAAEDTQEGAREETVGREPPGSERAGVGAATTSSPSPSSAGGRRNGRAASRDRASEELPKTGAGKRKKKKEKEEAPPPPPPRPVLSAVPPLAPVEAEAEVRQPIQQRRPAAYDGGAAIPSSRPSQPTPSRAPQSASVPPRRPKRELPPYLRVVK